MKGINTKTETFIKTIDRILRDQEFKKASLGCVQLIVDAGIWPDCKQVEHA